MKESNEINLPRYGRVLGAANAAARQTPGALVRCAEKSEAFVNTVRLTVPPDAMSRLAVFIDPVVLILRVEEPWTVVTPTPEIAPPPVRLNVPPEMLKFPFHGAEPL